MSDDTSKHLKALAVASACAPYLTSFFMGIPLLLTYGLKSIGDAFEFVVATLIMGTAGLVIYGLPIAIAAGGLGHPDLDGLPWSDERHRFRGSARSIV